MDSLENLIQKYGGLTEEYKFYNGEVCLRYDKDAHLYLLVKEDGTLEPQDGVSTACHILDKSRILIPWACKMMQQKLQVLVNPFIKDGWINQPIESFEAALSLSKSAHKDKLEDAGNVGSIAHAWIEEYIKAKINHDLGTIDLLGQNMPFDERAKNACLAALEWMHKHQVVWVYTERKVYSRNHKYAGTMDGLCYVTSCDNPLCCPNKFESRLAIADWKSSNYLYPEYLMQTAAYESAYEEETGVNVQDRWIIRLGKDDAKFEAWHLEEEHFAEDFATFLSALDLRRKFDALEERLSDIKDVYRKGKKKEKKEQKEKEFSKKCKKFDKYKGTRKPNCNGGIPCEACWAKYVEVQASKPEKTKTAKKIKLTQEVIIKNLANIAKNT